MRRLLLAGTAVLAACGGGDDTTTVRLAAGDRLLTVEMGAEEADELFSCHMISDDEEFLVEVLTEMGEGCRS